jgi:DNA-binding XRE family transcriptional regulator
MVRSPGGSPVNSRPGSVPGAGGRSGADCHPRGLAFGKAVYDIRIFLGLTVGELGRRVGMTDDEVECIEEGGTEPTIALLRHLAAALDADVRLTSGYDLGSVWFESHAA